MDRPIANLPFHLSAKADDALEEARRLPHGPARSEALKKAGLLRNAADLHGIIFARKGRPPND